MVWWRRDIIYIQHKLSTLQDIEIPWYEKKAIPEQIHLILSSRHFVYIFKTQNDIDTAIKRVDEMKLLILEKDW